MSKILTIRAAMLAGLCSLVWSSSWGFSEDICYHYQNTQNPATAINPAPFNCWDLQCRDGALAEVPASASTCVVTGLARYADASLLGSFHVRNSIHFDVTWLAARIQGMSAADARSLALFAEATDLGSFQHYDYLGQPITGAAADSILGVQRTNMTTGGFWLHFIPWRQPTGSSATTSELSYTAGSGTASPYPAQEVPLAHLRAWAFGQQAELCDFGMTDSNGPIGNCLTGANRTLYYDLPLLADPKDAVDIRVRETLPLEWQRVHPQSADCKSRDCYVPEYSKQKAGSLAALGVYLHALADRLSHYHCSDESFIANTWMGPDAPKQTASHYLYYPDICGTVAHVSLHYAETGQPALPERSRDAVRIAYQEIGTWMDVTRYKRETVTAARGFPEPTSVEAVGMLIDRALTKPTAAERIGALCEVGSRGYGQAWHDNNPDCAYPTTLTMSTAGSIAGISNGKPKNFALTGIIRPSQSDSGHSGETLIVFRTPDQQWFSFTPNGAAPITDWNTTVPAYRKGNYEALSLPLLTGTADLSIYKGTEIYLGFGASLSDILTRQRYSRIGVIR